MERKAAKAVAVCTSVMLTAFLLPTTLGYADDEDRGSSGSSIDAPSEPKIDQGPGGSFDDSANEGSLPEVGEQKAEGAAQEPIGAPRTDEESDAAELGEEVIALDSGSELGQEATELDVKEAEPVQSYSGATMFETAVAEAKAAYPKGSDTAIIVGPGDSWIDALSATGLAASKGPILFTERGSLHPATRQAFKDLGVKSVIIIGGTAAVTTSVEQAIKGAGVAIEARLGGANCYDTQMKIYEYGRSKGFWDASTAIVATGSHYGDALSISPVAFAKKLPIFLVESGGAMRNAQMQALVQGARGGGFTSLIIVGGPAAVSNQVEGFVSGITYWNGGSYIRLSGATQYETSAQVANWAASSQGFSWDNLAFTTGKSPYDALAGSVLQGGSRSVLLLVDDAYTATLSAAAQHKAGIDHVRFLGGTAAVSQSLRGKITSTLEISTTARPKAVPTLEERAGDEPAAEEEALASSGETASKDPIDIGSTSRAEGGTPAASATGSDTSAANDSGLVDEPNARNAVEAGAQAETDEVTAR